MLTLAALAEMTDTQERGYAFERHVADLLRREQFEVVTRAGRANGRQVDLFASRGDRHFLVETKWRKAKVGTPEVDDLRRRLERGVPNVVGVLISWSGFAKSALARVEQDASRPILLVSGAELVRLEVAGTIHRLLTSKHQQLVAYRRATVLDSIASPAAAPASSPRQAAGQYAFLTSNRERVPTLELAGGFGPVAFRLELPNLDWGDGRAVAVEVALSVATLAGLKRVFERLEERGWVTPGGSWRIHQQGATWNGFGLEGLIDALSNPDARYADRLMHHSESLTYIDTAGDGLYCLTAQVGRTRVDQVSTVIVSFRLPGIPLDPSSLQTLVRGLEVDIEPYFRSLGEPVADRLQLPPWVRKRRLCAEALIVGDPPMLVSDGDGDGGQEWVLGAVVENPFRATSIGAWGTDSLLTSPLAELGRDNHYLICALGSWHYASERRDYVIDSIDAVRVGDRLVTRVHLDWFDEAAAERRDRRPGVAEWVGQRVDRALAAAGTRLRDRSDDRRVRVVRVESTED